MRTKQKTLIIGFSTTTDAFAMEEMAKRRGFEGRLIPVPREISTSCGLCWAEDPVNEATITTAIEEEGLQFASKVTIEL